jgi:cytochrome d ubiquinol oxidase subunit I
MASAGPAIGPAFTLEAFAFFIEAIFLGIYLYGWQRLSPKAHWLSGIPIAIAGAASSVLVTAANAWMQNPVDFAKITSGASDTNLFTVLFTNPYWPVMAIHSTIACYAATAFAVAGVYAWGTLRGKRDQVHQAALRLALAVGLIAAFIMPLTGHISALVTAKYQPAKLAAMEALFTTEKAAPLRIGGIPNTETGEVRLALNIPYGLSILATGRPNAEVTGLDKYAREDWPNVPLTHFAFQIMVGAGMFILLAAIWYWWKWKQVSTSCGGSSGITSPCSDRYSRTLRSIPPGSDITAVGYSNDAATMLASASKSALVWETITSTAL